MLSELELKIINFLKNRKKADLDEIVNNTNLSRNSVISLLELLKSKGYVEIIRRDKVVYETTEEGKQRINEGFPEERLIEELKEGAKSISELRLKLGRDLEIALGWAKKKGLVKIENDIVVPLVKNYVSPEREALLNLDKVDENILKILKQRNLLKVKTIPEISVILLRDIEETKIDYITHLSPELIKSGKWREYKLKEYNVSAIPPYSPIGKKHFMVEFLENVRDVMRELGFEEVHSGYIELEFFNFDMLFQPQDHPAREIHDNFSINAYGEILDKELMNKVKEVHEKGWNYKWNEEISKRLVLRSQTTATTARILSTRPKSPIRVYTIGKVFRPDKIDATHLIEFHQLDGLIIESDFSFRDLLGVLKEIHTRLGINRIKFKPAYFPFTEPSVEVYGYLDKMGWVEVCGAGLLRPEVTEPAGISDPAGAWGIGLERLAMAFLKVNDIRNLYSDNIEYLRARRII
jgi:phenylalanyl-tRNA synthetase alpha chain